MRILHLVHWYPYKQDPLSGSWIAAHIASMSSQATQCVYHVEAKKGPWHFSCTRYPQYVAYRCQIPIAIARIHEWMSMILVYWVLLLRVSIRHYDCLNIHIAYPNALYIHALYPYLRSRGCKVVFTEHWSAYRSRFGIKNPKKTQRIQRIFHQGIPLITVSASLSNDIQSFAATRCPSFVVPNVVNTRQFCYDASVARVPYRMFALSRWKRPKQMGVLIAAWRLLRLRLPEATLSIAGFGPQWDELQYDAQHARQAIDGLSLLGLLSPDRAAHEMQSATLFVHASDYETFSVVCAEALCCGTPVLASNRGGIPEFVHHRNGCLLYDNTPQAFAHAMEQILTNQNPAQWTHQTIAQEAKQRFNPTNIGKKYLNALNHIHHAYAL